MLFLTVKFGWDVEIGRLNLDVKFMVLIISVSVLFVKIVACFFLLFCLASGVLLLWEYFRAMEELYTDTI